MKRLLFTSFIALALFLAACGGQSTTIDTTENDSTDVAKDTLGELGALLKELDQKIAESPNDANLYHERSYLYFRIGSYDQSMKDIDRALLIDSLNGPFHITKGEIYFAQFKASEAKTEFERAIAINPKLHLAEQKIAKIYMHLKNWPEALKHINASLKINSNNAEAYFMKGEIYEETGDTALAASSFQTACEQDPDYYDAFIRLGILYAKAHSALAIDYYNTAIKLQPNSIEAYYNKAIFCQEHDMTDQAIELYDKILSLNPNADLAYYNKGYIYLIYKEDYNAAANMFEKTVRINPSYKEAYHNLGLAYEGQGNYKKARENYKNALKLDPVYDLSALALDELDRKGLK